MAAAAKLEEVFEAVTGEKAPRDRGSGVSVRPVVRVQGNWKRRAGVATRYELSLAIDRLLARGRIEIAEGHLRRAERRWVRPGALTAEERWARADAELRAFCQRIEVHETRSARVVDMLDPPLKDSSFEASTLRSAPRRGIEKYVLRELKRAGSLGYDDLIDKVFVEGGLEWRLEDRDIARRRAKGKR